MEPREQKALEKAYWNISNKYGLSSLEISSGKYDAKIRKEYKKLCKHVVK